jgi:hypothetical protein
MNSLLVARRPVFQPRRTAPATFAFLTLLVALFACDSRSPTEPSVPVIEGQLSERLETEHFLFHYSPGDTVDGERQEAHFRYVVGRLGVSPPQKVDYFKYRSRSQLQQLTGRATNGFAEGFTVHTIFSFDPHEAVHVYSALVGRPSDFFNEGLAVAWAVDPLAGSLDGSYSGVSVHDWARSAGSELEPISEIVTTSEFRGISEAVGYQEAGSFLQFLVDTYGTDGILVLFGGGQRGDSQSRIEATFQQAYGFSLEQADRNWRSFLGI